MDRKRGHYVVVTENPHSLNIYSSHQSFCGGVDIEQAEVVFVHAETAALAALEQVAFGARSQRP